MATAFAAGDASAEEMTRAALDRILAQDSRIGAFLTLTGIPAMNRARELDARRAAGDRLGPLAGVPIAVKDNICTRGIPTTCASRILEGYVPPYDATVVDRLAKAGAIVVGKTNMDEFAMGSSTENSALKVTRNPWDLARVPGGSSGGSAAAVAAGMVPLALGSDTGGSIRQPAALCGVVGVKPTYGAVSRYGLVAFASSLDQIGPFARTVEDAALLYEAIAGHDPLDSTALPEPVLPVMEALDGDLRNLRIGLIRELAGEGIQADTLAAVRAAAGWFAAQGAQVEEVSLPTVKFGIAAYYVVANAEASANLARYDGIKYGLRIERADLLETYRQTRSRGFGAEVKRRIMLGTYALSSGYYEAYYKKAQQARTRLRQDFAAAFERCDVLLSCTSPTTAFRIGERTDDPLGMYLSDVATVAANLAGIPAISIPCGLDGAGLPIGLQLQGPAMSEPTLFRVAQAFERAHRFEYPNFEVVAQ
ncbi:MAG: Asp-tRNA(Asn)/Glu-tRNA(Gln) amidotransferase subunit GatA [Candidatus Sericytochromatia bacterium]|uniref:Glutamyl-tRNA(Gln) amidotransferase subunit A n=1 Tax=Candidatus Tanganyikabacteria bacterium TaxID=2961651 RepID=A0A937X6K8_9BACT|nr:Asp-tRNA(Asn)/Glu-tRNA(Gln) amidotransferase subunit GatA [Candidatus Tanganyikabacteria bacterium]